ncbi:Protein of unknown function (DUF3592) [Micromonospora viridifaciens]|uniref:DUF3592 domain-containing protein n=1 Tax=Micromonospora viridifaciens TaxID=1881 RepID=A0A1C4YDF2_MICVI|nr:DUF3592 domain-containing protein [Micromonospora viridifaciens]SCF18802.1 Protein of unknown function (DUF3592) [Micromonospora viridifaciens]
MLYMVGAVVIVLFFAGIFLVIAYIGFAVIRTRWIQGEFRRSGRGIRVEGVCVDLGWTGSGLVRSGIRYQREDGRESFAWTRYRPSIPVQVGDTARVLYDPKGKAHAVVNGDFNEGSYVAGALLCAFGLFFFGGLLYVVFW